MPPGRRARPLADRFWEKVKKSRGCWEFQGARSSNGYGNFLVGSRVDGTRRTAKAHRIAWMLAYGEPGELWVLHRCDNPPCCRPDHLFLGTSRENMIDMYSKGRGTRNGARPGARHHNAKLTKRKVDAIRRIYRSGTTSQRELGERYGVSKAQIGKIVRGERWQKGIA